MNDQAPRGFRLASQVAILALAMGSLVAAWEVAARVIQAGWMIFKFNELTPVTAGRETFALFTALSAVGAGATWYLSRSTQDRWRLVARVIAGLYLAAWLVWSAMLASPLAYFAR